MKDEKGLGGYGIKGLRKSFLMPSPPWTRKTFRYWPTKTYPRPSRDAAPQWLVYSLTRRLYAKCRNVGKGKSWYLSEDFTTLCQMSKCVSWKKKWIRMVAWCFDLDGRRDRDECAKPIVGRGTGPAVDPVAVFSLVRFQETEMIRSKKGLKRMHGIKGIGLGC